MSYARPDHDSADATWAGLPAYTRPAHNAADASFVGGALPTTQARLADSGPLGEPAIYAVLPLSAHLADDGGGLLPAPAVFAARDGVAWIADDGPLGAVQIVGLAHRTIVLADDGEQLLAFYGVVYSDPTPYIDPAAPVGYAMDLLAAGSATRVPISSWQATLQTGAQCYLQCVIPAFGDWAAAVQAADEFVIWRLGRLLDGTPIEMQMARSTLQSVQTDRGPNNYTCTISGYSNAFAADAAPSALHDRALSGVRSISTYSSTGIRVRCAIDWMLRPAQRAIVGDGLDFVVGYINLYAIDGDAYMDCGTGRVQ